MFIKNNKTIVIVTPFFAPNIGGLETHLKYYTDFLASRNIQAKVLTYRPLTTPVKSYARHEINNSVEIYRYWWWGNNLFERLSGSPALEFIYMAPKLLFHVLIYSLSHRGDISVFHAHGLIAAFVVRIVSIFIKTKKVVSTHYIYNLQKRPVFRKVFLWVFADFDKVLAVGEESKRDLISIGCPEDKIEVYNHSIDNRNLFVIKNKAMLREKYSFESDETIVLFVGRLIEMKGIKTLVKAASLNRDIRFIFVGTGELAKYLKESALIYANISYLGERRGVELAEIYNISDMVVLPSTEEGSSLVVAEALSCGKPVIVTNRGCSKDMFPDELGKKIEPSEENISMAIRQLENKVSGALQDKCRSFAVGKFGVGNLQKILDSYL